MVEFAQIIFPNTHAQDGLIKVKISAEVTISWYVYVIGILTARYCKISSREPEYESLRPVIHIMESGDDILKYLSVQNSDNKFIIV